MVVNINRKHARLIALIQSNAHFQYKFLGSFEERLSFGKQNRFL